MSNNNNEVLGFQEIKTKKIAEFTNSQEFKEWKKDIRRRRLETIDRLLSSGEWISNTQMMEAVNELYLIAPNEYCEDPGVPHRIIESQEGGRKQFEKTLYLYYESLVRQDRFSITSILNLLGKGYIYERKGEDGVEGAYRYNTKYSIFDKHAVYDEQYSDFDIYNDNPPITDKRVKKSRARQKDRSTEVSEHIEQLDFPTIQALQRLKKAMAELKRTRDINNRYISNLLDNAFAVYESRRDGWEKVFLTKIANAYDVASNPDSDYDLLELMKIRDLLISAKEFDSDYSDILTLLREQQKVLLSFDSVPDGFSESEILYLIKHFVFETYEEEGMIKELRNYYDSCVNEGKVIIDGDLNFALKCLCFKGPEKWEYNGLLLSHVNKLISFFFRVNEEDHFSTGMLVSLFYLKLNIEKAEKGEEPITEDEIIDLYIGNGWEDPLFQS